MSSQLVHDLKLIVSTDKRIWAAVGFIVVVLVMWALTDSWRPPIVIPEEKTVKLIQESSKYDPASSGMVEDLSVLNKTNEKLQTDINRISEELNSKQEEITWQMDGLISRLGSIHSSIDDITHKIGENKVAEFQRERRQKPRKIRAQKLE